MKPGLRRLRVERRAQSFKQRTRPRRKAQRPRGRDAGAWPEAHGASAGGVAEGGVAESGWATGGSAVSGRNAQPGSHERERSKHGTDSETVETGRARRGTGGEWEGQG